jgi:hypothetical protein
MSPYGFAIRIVPIGYVVEHEGETLTVDRHNIVARGYELFMTQAQYSAMEVTLLRKPKEPTIAD